MKRRQWRSYINCQKYSECQLISLLNARYFLTGERLDPDSEEYDRIVHEYSAHNGAAIGLHRLYKKWGIQFIEGGRHILCFMDGKKMRLPLEGSFRHPKIGYHSALIVDYNARTDAVRIANFREVTTCDGWLFRENIGFYESLLSNDLRTGDISIRGKYQYRLVGLEKEAPL